MVGDLRLNVVTLPWPPKALSPNARLHWAALAKHKALYRDACYWQCMQQKLRAPHTDGKLHLWIDFYPPDKRHRDDDNLIASFKSGRDGLAQAIGVDDKRFICHPRVMDEIGGMVKVRITATIEEAVHG